MMAHVLQPTYRDKKTGKRKKQRIWVAKFNLQSGEKPIIRPTGQTDKRAAERRLAEMIEEERRLREGLVDPALLHRRKTLDDHVMDFEDEKRGTDTKKESIDEVMNNLREILGFLPTRALSGLHQFKLRDYLESDAVKAKPRENWKTVPEGDLSARSKNKRIKALKQFGRWLEDTGRIPKSPFRRLQLLNEASDLRRWRTVYTQEQYEALRRAALRRPLAEAKQQRVNKGVTPQERRKLRRLGLLRVLAYDLGHGVGMRRDEIVTLRWLDLDLPQGLVSILTKKGKAMRLDTVPVESHILRRLRSLARKRSDRRPQDRLFNNERGRTVVPNPKTLRRDMASAGIDPTNQRGEVLDFHALRTTFITNQANKGTLPHRLQKLARHAKIETTLKYYTRVTLDELRAEVEKALPERVPTRG